MADNDDQVETTATHRGHTVKVFVSRGAGGKWYWRYLVDGRIDGRGRVPCPNADFALQQGVNAAKARAEGL